MTNYKKQIDRRGFIKASAQTATALAGANLSMGCASRCPEASRVFELGRKTPALAELTRGKPPNILLILTDQERYEGNLPGSLARPHFKRLKEMSVNFSDTFCAYPLCSPSRAAIMSGMYPHQTGVTHNMIFPAAERSLNPRSPHIGSVLASAGYKTAYKGKWDLSKGPTFYMVNVKDRGRAGEYGFEGHCGKVPDQEYGYAADDQVVSESCDWIQSQSADQPWFLCCSIINPHDICHPQLKPDQSIRDDVALPESLHDDLLSKPADQLGLRESIVAHVNQLLHPSAKPFDKYTDRDWELFLSFYYDLIEGTDRYIGQLFQALEHSDMLDNTIIIYTSDHGELGGAHGFSGKYQAYEEDLHVPLYIAHPEIQARQVSSLVSNTSIAPTIASLAGADWPSPIPGLDLSDWIKGGSGPVSDAIFSETQADVNLGVYKQKLAMRMVRTERWKYSYSFYDIQDGQLYDLDNDPIEMNNLFHDPAHRGIRKELQQRLRAWQEQTNDVFRVPVS